VVGSLWKGKKKNRLGTLRETKKEHYTNHTTQEDFGQAIRQRQRQKKFKGEERKSWRG